MPTSRTIPEDEFSDKMSHKNILDKDILDIDVKLAGRNGDDVRLRGRKPWRQNHLLLQFVKSAY